MLPGKQGGKTPIIVVAKAVAWLIGHGSDTCTIAFFREHALRYRRGPYGWRMTASKIMLTSRFLSVRVGTGKNSPLYVVSKHLGTRAREIIR